MTQQADSLTLSPFMFGEVFLVGAVAMQRQIVESMMTAFDAVADAMSDSLHATAALAHGIGNAHRASEAAAAGAAWFQGRMEKALCWWWTHAERQPHRSAAKVPAATAVTKAPEPAALPAPPAAQQAPVARRVETIAAKPPAGKLRQAPVVVHKMPKKPARPASK